MHATLASLINRLDEGNLVAQEVIPWGAPVPSFGDARVSRVATVGLNPSNREFVDETGVELQGVFRRFHTLRSLGIEEWAEADATHLDLIIESCRAYFFRNPYDAWFRRLDKVLSGTGSSYYDPKSPACHLDLIPYATGRKWAELSPKKRAALLKTVSDTLAILLRDSNIGAIVLNGISVVENFQRCTGVTLIKQEMTDWTLPRREGGGVAGFSYRGVIDELVGLQMARPIIVLGYNHNIQSSFGVTTRVVNSIRDWITAHVSGI